MASASRFLATLPPWLWLWLAFFVYEVPGRLYQIYETVEFHIQETLSYAETFGLWDLLLLPLSLVDFAPLLALVLGVVLIFLPHLRKRYVERSYRLGDPPQITAVKEIEAFVHTHAPELRIRSNLSRPDLTAFVYPTGYRRAAIAVFAGLAILWRRDRGAAEAILLHEIAHYRHGEALIVGAGSFLERTLRLWWLFLLLIVLVPLALWLVNSTISIVESMRLQAEFSASMQEMMDEMREAGLSEDELRELALDSDALGIGELLLQKLDEFVTLQLRSMVLASLTATLWAAAWFVPFVVGVWCAEINADRYAASREAEPGALRRALHQYGGPRSVWRWVLGRISHPPRSLRRWAVRGADRPGVLLLLLLLFPAVYIVRLIILLGWGVVSNFGAFLEPGDLPALIPYWIALYLREQFAPFLFLAALLLILWLFILALRRSRPGPIADFLRSGGRQIIVFPVLAVAMLVTAVTLRITPAPIQPASTAAYQPSAVTPKAEYAPGEPIVVHFSSLPGNPQDWISVVEAGAPPDNRGTWQFTEGELFGRMEFPPQPPGSYEVRVYLNWPEGGFDVQSSFKFKVVE